MAWGVLGKTYRANKNSVLDRAHINLITLQTLVVEIENILNNRPLTHVSDDPNDMEPLTYTITSVVWTSDHPSPLQGYTR